MKSDNLYIGDNFINKKAYPNTRYMGSKFKLIPHINKVLEKYTKVQTVLDAFGGSGCISYLLKNRGYEVTTNDFLTFSYQISKAVIENNNVILDKKDIENLIKPNKNKKNFISETFEGLYFSAEDNQFLDNLWSNIQMLDNEYKKALAFASAHRACLKKRPRGIFAYTGFRYDDGRRDIQISLQQQFLEAVNGWNSVVFDNKKKNKALNQDVFEIKKNDFDLVYFDPPYVSSKSDNDYTRRYHFLEGFSSYWKNDKIDFGTKTKKIKSKKTDFSTKNTIYDAFDRLFNKFKNSIIILSYYSNGIPNKDELISILGKYKKNVEIVEVDYSYSFGTHGHKIGNVNNRVKEYLIIGV